MLTIYETAIELYSTAIRLYKAKLALPQYAEYLANQTAQDRLLEDCIAQTEAEFRIQGAW